MVHRMDRMRLLTVWSVWSSRHPSLPRKDIQGPDAWSNQWREGNSCFATHNATWTARLPLMSVRNWDFVVYFPLLLFRWILFRSEQCCNLKSSARPSKNTYS